MQRTRIMGYACLKQGGEGICSAATATSSGEEEIRLFEENTRKKPTGNALLAVIGGK